ncbi:MAG: LLM class flavin-dependent oxidoreductase [Nitrospinota bacterium]
MKAGERLGRDLSFGVCIGAPFVDGFPDLQKLLRDVEALEALGYDALWVSDHVVTHTPVHDPFVLLSAFAARTSRILLGTGVLLLPLRHPTLVAKALSVLDHLSGGRVVFGAGVGGEFREEFEACGVPVSERGARANEALEVIGRLWTEERVTHRGRFYSFENVNLDPRPLQPGGPSVWVGGRSDAALRRAAFYGRGWMSYLMTPERVAQGRDKLRDFALRAGKNPDGFALSLLHFFCVDDSPKAARAMAVDNLTRTYRQPFEPLVDKYASVGPPEAHVEFLRRYVEIGVRHFDLRPVCPPEDLVPQFRRIAEEVIPRLRSPG